MKKLKLFYNPFSGNKSFKFDLDVCIGIFQEGGYEVHPFRTLHPGDIDTHIATMDPNYDIIVASSSLQTSKDASSESASKWISLKSVSPARFRMEQARACVYCT